MQLPGPLGGRVAFELMLNTAQRVADVLEGTLIDEREQVLTSEIIVELRDRIAQFERRPMVI
jgi:cell division protein ZipA